MYAIYSHHYITHNRSPLVVFSTAFGGLTLPHELNLDLRQIDKYSNTKYKYVYKYKYKYT